MLSELALRGALSLLKPHLPFFLSQLEGGVLENFLLGLREEHLKDCVEGETIELLQTTENIDGLDIAMLNVVALDENCCVRLIKGYKLIEILKVLFEKITKYKI